MSFIALYFFVLFYNARSTLHNGYPGHIGQIGQTGRTGQTGQKGPTGKMVMGSTGNRGGTGATGASGLSGVTGNTGAPGATGSAGVTGAPGAGNTGLTGATGPNGPNGPNGNTGNTGNVLSVGPLGAQGPTGVTGSLGVTGATGTTGIGNPGPVGAAGPSGPDSAAGLRGATGPVSTADIYIIPATMTTNFSNGLNSVILAPPVIYGQVVDKIMTLTCTVTAALQGSFIGPTYFNIYLQLDTSPEYLPLPVPNLVGSGTAGYADTANSNLFPISVSGAYPVSISANNLLFLRVGILSWTSGFNLVNFEFQVSYSVNGL